MTENTTNHERLLDCEAQSQVREAARAIFPDHCYTHTTGVHAPDSGYVEVRVHFKDAVGSGYIEVREIFDKERGSTLEVELIPTRGSAERTTYDPQKPNRYLPDSPIMSAIGQLRVRRVSMDRFVLETARARRAQNGEMCLEKEEFRPILHAVGLHASWEQMTEWLRQNDQWPQEWRADLDHRRWRFFEEQKHMAG